MSWASKTWKKAGKFIDKAVNWNKVGEFAGWSYAPGAMLFYKKFEANRKVGVRANREKQRQAAETLNAGERAVRLRAESGRRLRSSQVAAYAGAGLRSSSAGRASVGQLSNRDIAADNKQIMENSWAQASALMREGRIIKQATKQQGIQTMITDAVSLGSIALGVV